MRKTIILLFLLILCGIGTGYSGTGTAKVKYNEAPMLRELVRAGKLPPVEQRLPKEPFVVKPVEKIGKYGGTFRHVNVGGPGWEGLGITEYMRMLRGDINFVDYQPSIAKGWKVSPDC